MIPKISSGNSYYGLLAYLEKKPKATHQTSTGIEVVAGSVRIDAGNFFSTGIVSTPLLADKSELNKAFINWDINSKDIRFKNKVAHFSLSFSPLDTIDQQKTIVVAKDFLKQMGYEQSPYVVYQHNDKHHNHIHIVTSRVGEGGKKIDHDYEARKAIKIARSLEIEYQLTKVESISTKKNVLDNLNENTLKASSYTPFKNTVLQNLQYYINAEKVKDISTLINCLASQGITMQYQDKEGNRLPKNGVRFYYMEDNKIISYLSGRDLQKGFFNDLVKKLEKNSVAIPTVKEKQNEFFVPTVKPNSYIIKTIGPSILNILEIANSSIFVTKDELTELFKKVNVEPEFTFDKSGQLKGLAFVFEQKKYKASDFNYKGIRLSAAQFSPYIIDNFTGNNIVNRAIQYCQTYNQHTDSKGLTKEQIHEILKRNHIRVVEKENGIFLQIAHLGKNLQIDLNKYPDGSLGFYNSAGMVKDQNVVLTIDQTNSINKLKSLSVHEKSVYQTVLSGDIKKIQEISQIQVHLPLSKNEHEGLGRGLAALHYYNSTHNRIQRASNFIQDQNKKESKTTLNELVFALNLRGVAVLPEFKNINTVNGVIERSLTNITFKPLDQENKDLPALNFHQINANLSAEYWKSLWEESKNDTNSIFYNNTSNPGLYYDIDPETTEMFISAETEPSLIKNCDFTIEHPYMDSNIEYVESLEPDNFLYTYPDHDTHALSTIFRDYGKMTNRGSDNDIFKKLKKRIFRK